MANWITRKQLAEKLAVSEATIDRMVRKGLPVIRLTPGCVRFDPEAVEAHLRGHQEPAGAAA
jgi:hypothetical protein